jgi:Na+-transporting methylmalonyl-CoA/oxaloacetate decarboxylase gamma subunit
MDFTHQQFGLEITLVGMGIVFLSLLLIVGAISLMKRLDERWQAAEARSEEEAFGRTPTIDLTTLVLIAAAAATLVAGRHRIRAVRRLTPADGPSSAWSVTGRTVLQGSHIISPRAPRR